VTKPADANDLELVRLKAKLGEAVLERELLAEKVAALEAGRPLARRRPRR
jgi:transposase